MRYLRMRISVTFENDSVSDGLQFYCHQLKSYYHLHRVRPRNEQDDKQYN